VAELGVRDEGPVCSAQQRLWFLQALSPADPSYNISAAVEITGPLSLSALRQAIHAVCARHPALRSVFRFAEGRLTRHTTAVLPPLCVVDLGGRAVTGDAALPAEADALLRRLAGVPFDLSAGPPARWAVLHCSPRRHVLQLVVHHIVFDAASLAIVVRDLQAAYARSLCGRPGRRNPAHGSMAAADGPAASDAAVGYWRHRLADLLPRLLVSSRPPGPAAPGAVTARISVTADQLAVLRALARQRGCTLYMVLTAVLLAVLQRYSGEDDLLVGIPVSTRQGSCAEAVGMFVNLLPLRVKLAGNPGFTEILSRVRDAALAAFDHRHLPFEQLVDALQLKRSAGLSPVFQILVAHQRRPGVLQLAGATTRPVPVPPPAAKYDLTVTLTEDRDTVDIDFEADAGVFDEVGVGDLAGRFGWLLGVVARDPGVGVGGLGLVGAGERSGVVAAGEGVVRARAGGVGVHGLVWDRAGRCPDAVAVSGPGGVLTYRGLVGWAAGLAARLRACGVGPESRVGVLLERSVLLPGVVLGIWQAGGVYVPLDPGDPAARLEWMAGDAGLVAVVTEGGLAGRCPAGAGRVVDVAGVRAVAAGAAVGVHLDQAAYVMYTSGSTGRPKGVVVPHRGIVNRLLWMQEDLGCGAGDRVLHKAPVTFDVSLWELLWALLAGGCVVVARPGGHRDGGYLAGLVAAERVSVAHFVPSLLGPFLAEAGGLGAGPLGRVVCSGEELSGALRDRFAAVMARARLLNLYGPTEASVDVTWWECGPGEAGPVPIGRPVANTGVHVLDRWLQPVPCYAVGELCLRGEALARGYLGRPGLTAAVFVPDPLGGAGGRVYRTGDRGRRRRDGAVEFLGRADAQVKIGGNRVEPGEIEQVLRQVPGVAGAAVTVTGTGAAARITGYIVPDDPASPPPGATIRAVLASRLPAIMIPSALVPLPRLPLTRNGKLDHSALPPPPHAPTATPPGAARGPLEQVIAQAWCRTLGLPRVGVRDNFFEAGGNSLLLLALFEALRGSVDGELTVADLFRYPTVAALADFIGGRTNRRAAGQRGIDRARLRAAARAAAPALGMVRHAD
jgi:amino acid adenylation domain-containing protein